MAAFSFRHVSVWPQAAGPSDLPGLPQLAQAALPFAAGTALRTAQPLIHIALNAKMH
jgi:hypothetical protein